MVQGIACLVISEHQDKQNDDYKGIYRMMAIFLCVVGFLVLIKFIDLCE